MKIYFYRPFTVEAIPLRAEATTLAWIPLFSFLNPSLKDMINANNIISTPPPPPN